MKKIIKNLLTGGLGGVISPITETIKLVKNLKQSNAFDFLDTNHDGKFTIEDVRDLQWKTLGKIAAIGLLIYLAQRFGVLDLF